MTTYDLNHTGNKAGTQFTLISKINDKTLAS